MDKNLKSNSYGNELFFCLAPALAAVSPVLAAYSASIKNATLIDALACGIILVVAAVALSYILRLIYADPMRSSIAAVLVVAWTFAYSTYWMFGKHFVERFTLSSLKLYFLAVFWFLLLPTALFLLYWAKWSEVTNKRAYRSTLLVCCAAIGLFAFMAIRAKEESAQSSNQFASLWNNQIEGLPAAWTPGGMKNQRDVYYLLFDRYASGTSLKRFFDFDNAEFYKELEKRGFVVNRNATTSYPLTAPSMASTLNMRYLSSQLGSVSDYYDAVDFNETAKRFIQAGYKYFYFGNAYDPMRKTRLAHWNMNVSTMPSEIADSLVSMTPLRPLLVGRERKYDFTLEKFAAVAKLAKEPGLTFAYAHFLVPHPPYVFTRDGKRLSEIDRANRSEQQSYVNQLVATNRLILKLIDQLLAESSTTPVIILQADEGPYLMTGDESLTRSEQIAKRTGILNALLIPENEIRQRIATAPKPVNTFRFLFKEYFDAPIELLPERTFFWKQPNTNGSADEGAQIVEVTSGAATGP